MSFKSRPSIQSTSLHLPLHLSTAEDVTKELSELNGLQIIENGSGFSIALLTNFGDIKEG